jgi:hypothetical protein
VVRGRGHALAFCGSGGTVIFIPAPAALAPSEICFVALLVTVRILMLSTLPIASSLATLKPR